MVLCPTSHCALYIQDASHNPTDLIIGPNGKFTKNAMERLNVKETAPQQRGRKMKRIAEYRGFHKAFNMVGIQLFITQPIPTELAKNVVKTVVYQIFVAD